MQENSYYAYGMSMTSTMTLPTQPNKQLYNGGSEWQNDYQDQPDWQQTFYRNYDQALGRFLAVDPMAEATSDMSVYQYGNNNPVMFNDPLGDLSKADIESFGPLKYEDGLSGSFWKKTYGSEQEWAGAIQYFWDNNLGIYNHRDNSAFWNAVANAVNKFLDKYNSSNEEQSLSFNLGNVDNTHGYDLTWTNLETTTVNDKYVVSVLGGHTFVQGANSGGDDYFNQQQRPTTFESGLRNILSHSGTGAEISSNDLVNKYGVPKSAANLINSITKKSNNTVAVDWVSGWNPSMIAVKAISDAVFKDGTLNLRLLGNGALSLSGDAIGIKYNGTTYYNLILNGNNVTIPGVSGVYWKIGIGK